MTDADDKPLSSSVDAAWEARMAELWRAIDAQDAESFVAKVEAAAAELPPGHPIALFERACAQDSTGHPDSAAPLYRAALDAGLTGPRRRRAVIQMASSLRNLGEAKASIDLLTSEIEAGHDELDGAVRAFLALALVDLGREREAVTHSLLALANYLPRYNRSLARYATEISAKVP